MTLLYFCKLKQGRLSEGETHQAKRVLCSSFKSENANPSVVHASTRLYITLRVKQNRKGLLHKSRKHNSYSVSEACDGTLETINLGLLLTTAHKEDHRLI